MRKEVITRMPPAKPKTKTDEETLSTREVADKLGTDSAC